MPSLRIELRSAVYKTDVLPLYYEGFERSDNFDDKFIRYKVTLIICVFISLNYKIFLLFLYNILYKK